MILCAALALAATGCGDGEHQKQIRATLTAQASAYAKLDFRGACTQLTEAAQQASPWCEEDTGDATLGNEPIVTFNVRSSPISSIDVDGDTATVRREKDEPTYMLRVGERWLIDVDAEQAVRATYKAAEEAVRAHDFKRFCSLLTEDAQREQVKHGPDPDTDTCEASFAPPVNDDDDGFQTVQGFLAVFPPVEDVEVDGDRATIHHEDEEPTTLRRVDGRWRFD